MRTPLFWLVLLLGSILPLHAHIGDQSIIYEGLAGPYPVRVIVRTPGVVPGLAEISVRILQGTANRVSVLPIRYDMTSKDAPAPDIAEPVRGEPDLYNAQLWLMASGAFSIFVNVDGPAGTGTTIVPINSIATARLPMSRGFGFGLLAFGIFLVCTLISIVGAASREALVPPGEEPKKKWRPRFAMIGATVVLAYLLSGGRHWWNSEDRDYLENRLYRPEPATARVRTEGGRDVLQIERLDNGRGHPGLIPDHGKLMHAFLIRTDQSAFAHLHPIHLKDPKHFYEATLPPLPSGEYRLYADVTHQSGFTQTLVTNVSLTNIKAAAESSRPIDVALSDPDDSWLSPSPLKRGETVREASLADGLVMKWDSIPLLAKNEASLRFRVLETNGTPAVLEPYLGMQGHAVIEAADGSIFTHLHPFGNISMASQQQFVKRENKAGKQNLEVLCGLPTKGDAIVFPYEFPRSGRYRIWVQIKTHGQIMTAAFDAAVASRS